ncbi:MAG TPA: alpha/beta hydrolase [Steroidobacteraceae bacterium]|nr:alpha/beta hydrolase [Steroidobacteraceae bacterium]
MDPVQQSFEDFVSSAAARPGASRFADVAGIRMHYLEWQGPPGAPALLLLHGYLAHAHWWDFVAPWLAERYRVIAPDFSGMGDSGHRTRYDHATFHAEIIGIVEATGITGCTAVGHSFGGRVLLYACAERPDLFARAIVVDSRLGSPADPVRGFDEEWRPKKRYADAESILSRFVLRPIEPAPAAALRHMARASIREEDGGWVWKFDENVTRLYQVPRDAPGVDDTAALRHLPTPVDFVYGEESRVVTPARAALLADCLPNVRTVTGLPCSHHHLPVSQPLALLGCLRVLLQ